MSLKVSFYNGVTGMLAYQEGLNRISNNVSNVSTVGYKSSKSTFTDLLYTKMYVNSEGNLQTGHGVKIAESQVIYRKGPLTQTGSNLDFAMLDDGFFAVEQPDGSIQYTRSGAFNISMMEDVGYLVSTDGDFVLDADGNRIELTYDADGSGFDLENLSSKIGIYDVPNPFGLVPSNGSCFKISASSGEAYSVESGTNEFGTRHYQIVDGALEQSSVDISEEMADVIVTQKAFQLNARMVQTADQLEEIINNLR